MRGPIIFFLSVGTIFIELHVSQSDSEILGRRPKGLYFENTKVKTRFYCPSVGLYVCVRALEHAYTPFF